MPDNQTTIDWPLSYTWRVRRVRSNGIGLTLGDREVVLPKCVALEVSKLLRDAANEKCPRCHGEGKTWEASTATGNYGVTTAARPKAVCPTCHGAWV